MKVILLSDVKNVGKKGQVVEVSDGYGRNFLIARKLAVPETKKSKEVKQIIIKHSKDFNGTLTDIDVMKLAGVARKTYYKYKKELKEEQ